jgi:hypothetical protein
MDWTGEEMGVGRMYDRIVMILMDHSAAGFPQSRPLHLQIIVCNTACKPDDSNHRGQ